VNISYDITNVSFPFLDLPVVKKRATSKNVEAIKKHYNELAKNGDIVFTIRKPTDYGYASRCVPLNNIDNVCYSFNEHGLDKTIKKHNEEYHRLFEPKDVCPSCKGRVFPLNDCEVKESKLGGLPRIFKKRIPCMLVTKINTYGDDFNIKVPGNEIIEVLLGDKSKIETVVVCPERPDWGEHRLTCDAGVVNDLKDNTRKVTIDFDELRDKITDWAAANEEEDWATPYHVLTKEVGEKYNGR
jgi:hypothetical protein